MKYIKWYPIKEKHLDAFKMISFVFNLKGFFVISKFAWKNALDDPKERSFSVIQLRYLIICNRKIPRTN